jgi:5'-nucleotidase
MANFAELFDRRVDPRNRIYYWMDGKKAELEEGENVDDVAIRENLISITPVKYDLTNYEFIPELQNWLKEREEK